jgi:hypothetical protein
VTRLGSRRSTSRARPLEQRPDDPVPDGEVVADEVELRLAARREEHLVRIRDAHDALANLELDRRRGHVSRPVYGAP